MTPTSGKSFGPARPRRPLNRRVGTPIASKSNPFASGFKKFSLKKQKLSWSIVAYIAMIGFIVMITVFLAIYLIYLADLPPVEQLESTVTPQSSIIYDKSGKEIYRFYEKENRTYVTLPNISQHMKDAIISIEDKSFFENPGFDFRGLVRAGFNYVVGRTDKIQATSTLSQQLIRAAFLSNERSFDRKIKEAWLTFRLSNTYSKEKVLEFYLNKISFGNNAF